VKVTRHACNAYCRDGRHCDLVYASPGARPVQLWQALGYYRGLRVVRVEPATEAPPPGTQPLDVIATGSTPATEP
jgi:hypothetical protein